MVTVFTGITAHNITRMIYVCYIFIQFLIKLMFIGTTNLFNGTTEKNGMIIFHIA